MDRNYYLAFGHGIFYYVLEELYMVCQISIGLAQHEFNKLTSALWTPDRLAFSSAWVINRQKFYFQIYHSAWHVMFHVHFRVLGLLIPDTQSIIKAINHLIWQQNRTLHVALNISHVSASDHILTQAVVCTLLFCILLIH